MLTFFFCVLFSIVFCMAASFSYVAFFYKEPDSTDKTDDPPKPRKRNQRRSNSKSPKFAVVNRRFEINYVDLQGEKSSRIVMIKKFDRMNRSTKFTAYCELRDAIRTFYFSGITECVDIETGEVVEDLHQYLNEKIVRQESA